jgi:hypothetical protein
MPSLLSVPYRPGDLDVRAATCRHALNLQVIVRVQVLAGASHGFETSSKPQSMGRVTGNIRPEEMKMQCGN